MRNIHLREAKRIVYEEVPISFIIKILGFSSLYSNSSKQISPDYILVAVGAVLIFVIFVLTFNYIEKLKQQKREGEYCCAWVDRSNNNLYPSSVPLIHVATTLKH